MIGDRFAWGFAMLCMSALFLFVVLQFVGYILWERRTGGFKKFWVWVFFGFVTLPFSLLGLLFTGTVMAFLWEVRPW